MWVGSPGLFPFDPTESRVQEPEIITESHYNRVRCLVDKGNRPGSERLIPHEKHCLHRETLPREVTEPSEGGPVDTDSPVVGKGLRRRQRVRVSGNINMLWFGTPGRSRCPLYDKRPDLISSISRSTCGRSEF